jgi:hypothetical protein
MKRVRVLASILTCLIVLHGACMARCVGEKARMVPQSAAPPCHQPQKSDQNNAPMPLNTCLAGPALEAKSFPSLKCCLDTAVMTVAGPPPASTLFSLLRETPMEQPHIAPPLLLLSVLRI